MDRRTFSSGLIGAGLAAPLALQSANPALANVNERENEGLPSFARVQLQLLTTTVLVTWFIILTSRGLWGTDLRRPVRQFRASRANAGNIPLLGDLFRPPLTRRFSGSDIVGQVFLHNHMLVLVPLVLTAMRLNQIFLTHRELEYQSNGQPKRINMRTPIVGEMFRNETPVGYARQKGRNLLVLVRPTILRDEDF